MASRLVKIIRALNDKGMVVSFGPGRGEGNAPATMVRVDAADGDFGLLIGNDLIDNEPAFDIDGYLAAHLAEGARFDVELRRRLGLVV